jgi:hypothetical protein
MLKVEKAPIVIALLLIATPTVADGTSELARCELEAERLFRLRTTRVPRIGEYGRPIYRNGLRVSKRACGRLVTVSLQNVLLLSRPMKTV